MGDIFVVPIWQKSDRAFRNNFGNVTTTRQTFAESDL
tara:strand:- start:170 stop:280 length:111 start_codon:yes stop_codon:yes gene_type:complete